MSNSPLRALRGSLIVKQDDSPDATDSGILINKDIRSFRTGMIVSTGNECTNYVVGDRILYVKEAAYPMYLNEGTPEEEKFYYIDNENDVYVKLKDKG